jgi:Transposase DDE domain group 1
MTKLQLTKEKINHHGGLSLVGKLITNFCGLPALFREPTSARSDRISDVDILTSQIGLLVQGRTHYEDIELFRQDPGASFCEALHLKKIPAESTLRPRLEALATKATLVKLEGANLSLLKAHPPTPIEINGRKYLPNDIDVTPMDNTGSHRENLGRTYKGCDGFAPIMSNIGKEGFLLHHQLRPGVQHCQKNTPQFLKRNLQLLKKLGTPHPVLLRMDGGNDSADNVEILRHSGHYFLIKRNLRRSDPLRWLSHALSQQTEPQRPRPGKEIYIGTLEHDRPGGENSDQEPVTCVYCVTRRSIDKHGQELLIDDIEVECYWTNLGESPEDVIALYHSHGTSEQYHSELKSDLGIERFPSHSYAINQLYLALGAMAYNLLRAIDHRAIRLKDHWPEHQKGKKAKLTRRRVGSIIRDIINVAAKVVSHAGQKIIKIAEGWGWSRVIIAIDQQLA